MTDMTTTDPRATPAIGPSADELAAAIALYEGALPPGMRHTFDISALDTLGLPVIIDAFIPETGSWIDGYGYGASLDEARVGALGELSEDAHLSRALAGDPGITASFAEMIAREGAGRVIDPRQLALPAGSGWRETQPMRWLKVQRWPDGTAWVPREFVAHSQGAFQTGAPDPGIAPSITPITNGLGAGATIEQALSHAILELLQRDGNTTRFRAMDAGVVIDLDAVSDPGITSLLAQLRAHGIEPMAKLATTEFGITNVYVVDGGTAEPRMPLQATACGEAAHPNAERALRKALLEFMAARCRKAMMHGPLEDIEAFAGAGYLAAVRANADPDTQEPRALAAMCDWVGLSTEALRDRLRDTVLAERRRVALSDLPSVPDAEIRDPANRLRDLVARLASQGLEVLYYDATPASGGPCVVKTIVPGFECETMSYHRIGRRGVERLIAETPPDGNAPLAGLGTPPDGARRVCLTEDDEETLGGPAWLATDRIDAIVGALYPLYREPSSHTVQMHLHRTLDQGPMR